MTLPKDGLDCAMNASLSSDGEFIDACAEMAAQYALNRDDFGGVFPANDMYGNDEYLRVRKDELKDLQAQRDQALEKAEEWRNRSDEQSLKFTKALMRLAEKAEKLERASDYMRVQLLEHKLSDRKRALREKWGGK